MGSESMGKRTFEYKKKGYTRSMFGLYYNKKWALKASDMKDLSTFHHSCL